MALLVVLTQAGIAKAGECPNEQLRSESNVNPATGQPYSSQLPDCRAYELVSTGDKQDNDLNQPPTNGFADTNAWVAAEGGNALWQIFDYAYAAPSNGIGNAFESTRGGGGWLESPALAPPGSTPTWIAPVAATSNLSAVVLARFEEVENNGGLAEVVEREASGSYATIASGLPNGGSGPQAKVQLSEDGSRTFLETEVPLAGDTHSSGEQLYEWTRGGGLRVFAVNDSGEATSRCGAVLAGTPTGTVGHGPRDISRDGSRVAFLSPAPSSAEETTSAFCGHEPSDLYVREDDATTIDVSRPRAGGTDFGAKYVGMSADGSRVFFITRSQLTPDKATIDPDLYEYDLSTGALRRLSVGQPGYDDANVQSAVVSADGSHAYFEALGQLVPGAGGAFPPSFVPQPELTNLYAYSGGVVSYVANVNNVSDDGAGFHDANNGLESIGGLTGATAQVTPNGLDLLFSSASELTAYDNRGATGLSDTEMYRYDAASATISCVTCNPLGLAPGGSPPLTVANTSSVSRASAEQLPAMSEDGSTVFFASPDRLVGAATNAVDTASDRVYDVYEWHDGVLSLISSGASPYSDYILAATPRGSDILFVTRDELVTPDGDGAEDIYDARASGGFAASAGQPQCTSLATCRSSAGTPPVPVEPATVSIGGPGNLTPLAKPPQATALAKPHPPTRAQQLSRALKACKKNKRKIQRDTCRRQARRKYGPGHQVKESRKRGARS